MSKPIEYRPCLQGFALAVSEAVMATHERLFDRASGESAMNQAVLTDQLRAIYQERVKKLFERHEDACLARELGVVYGSLVTHLQSIHAQWLSFSTSNNRLVELRSVSDDCLQSAMRQGLRHGELAADVVAELVRVEASIRTKADLLAKLLTRHCLKYYYYPDLSKAFPGYPVQAFYVAGQTRKSVVLRFNYWDGVAACTAGTGDLFQDVAHRGDLQRIAQSVFGSSITFSADFNTIEFDEPVING